MATVIDRETDARFAAQSGIGRKLDPNNPADKPLIKTWLDIQAKVKAEAAAGTLVTTFDHPAVAQNLAAADAANQVAAAHLEAAAKAPDPVTAQQHTEAAKVAAKVATDKAEAAAAVQPRVISPPQKLAAAEEATKAPPPRHAPAKQHLAHKQIQAAGMHPRDLLMREADARFWATGYRPNHKLDPNDPADAKMLPLWFDIFRKVQAEDAAGKLVLTYNHPAVAQNLADAQVADQAAAMHLEAAAADPQGAPQNIAAATTAMQIAAQKVRGVAKLQPPTASGPLAHETAQRVARTPAGPVTTAAQQLARLQAQRVGQRVMEAQIHHRTHRASVRTTVSPKRLRNFRVEAVRRARIGGAPFVLLAQRADGMWEQQPFGSRADLEAAYARMAEQQALYRYVSAFDFMSSPMLPIHDSVGIPAAEHAEVPPEAMGDVMPAGGGPAPAAGPGPDMGPSAAPAPSAEPAGAPAAPAVPEPSPEAAGPAPGGPSPPGTSRFVKIAGAVVGAVVLGGIIVVASKRSKSGGRSRSPKVLVAGPDTSVRPTRVLRA